MYLAWLVVFCVVDANGAASSRGHLALIRPQTRFLIQSVVPKREFQVFNEFKKASVDLGQFCQASSSLLDLQASPVTLDLFQEHMGSVKAAVSHSNIFLAALSDQTRLDDYRSATEFRMAWLGTLVQEMSIIGGSVESLRNHYSRESSLAKELGKSAGSDDGSGEFLPVIDGIYALDAASHTLESEAEKEKSGDGILGHRSHSANTWASMDASFTKIASELEAKQNALEQLVLGAESLLEKHVASVKTGGEGYKMKWTIPEDKQVIPRSSDNPRGEKGSDTSEGTGEKLMRLLAKMSLAENPEYQEFESFINKKDDGHVKTLTRLMTTLNILQIRRLGLMDATNSLDALYNSVQVAITEQQLSLNTLLGTIDGRVNKKETQEGGDGKPSMSFTELAKLVYIESVKFDGVNIEETAVGEADHLDEQMKELGKYVGKNAHNEFIPQLNLIVNVLWRLHSHVLSFLGKYYDGETLINPEKLRDRTGADCMLYGRVDTLLRRLKLKDKSDTDMCSTDFQNAGIALMKSLGLTISDLREELRGNPTRSQKASSETGGQLSGKKRGRDSGEDNFTVGQGQDAPRRIVRAKRRKSNQGNPATRSLAESTDSSSQGMEVVEEEGEDEDSRDQKRQRFEEVESGEK
jgi:hypothetical protein